MILQHGECGGADQRHEEDPRGVRACVRRPAQRTEGGHELRHSHG